MSPVDPVPPPRVVVILPTYLEAENLGELVARIGTVCAAQAIPHEVVVVDDDSPDATAEVVAALGAAHPVRLRIRVGERGLATAVVDGIRASNAPVIVVMDADLSHPPEVIPALLSALDDADMALASRWVAGGGTADGWGLVRRVNSALATMLSRPLTGVRDPMSGFFAIRRETIDAGAALDPIGFKIALELIVKCDCRRVAEVPFVFQMRGLGRSKFGFRQQVLFLRHLWRLYRFRWMSRRR